MIVLALSSGTSVDGIDVAAVDLQLDAESISLTPLLYREVPFSVDLRADVLGALPPAATTLEQVCRLDTRLGQEFAAAARSAVDDLGEQVPELVVSHGQTLFHWVDDGQVLGTLQLGQPAWIAEATGLPVVSDVRINDVVAGGQGAPLASLLDVLLLNDRPQPAAMLNLGGIANVTIAGGGVEPIAFDTGPANALLDLTVLRATQGQEHADLDGLRASRGRTDPDLLAALLDHEYYRRTPPKSTGKELFDTGHLDAALAAAGCRDIGTDDLLATLVDLTAITVADAVRPHGVTEVLVSGGGAANPALMARMAEHLAPVALRGVDTVGLVAEAKEAHLFALIGFLTWNGLPGTVPSCTGARRATVAGRITPGAAPLRLPPPARRTPSTLLIHQP